MSQGQKRLHPEFNRPFKRGDVREDGYIFNTYVKTKVKKNGYYKEAWLSPAAYARFLKKCKECIRKCYESRLKERRQLIDEIKLSKGCSICGYKEHPVALDFDHLDPAQKKFTIGTRYTHSTIDALMQEIAKCRILCANCHRIETLLAFKAKNSKP
jgi:Pyruvate/2-oxoacid:ferredoxin oxidoreductase delta subunit